MAWAAKRPGNELLNGLFSGPLAAQFYPLFQIGPLPIFEITFNFYFSFRYG